MNKEIILVRRDKKTGIIDGLTFQTVEKLREELESLIQLTTQGLNVTDNYIWITIQILDPKQKKEIFSITTFEINDIKKANKLLDILIGEQAV